MTTAPRQSDATEIMGPDDIGRAPGDSEHPLPPGGCVGAYVVERKLGRGGGGVVYAARHRESHERVALKVLRSEMAAFPVMVARFAREVEALRKLAHPHIVELYDYGELASGEPYYAMELLEGVDLRSELRRYGRFSPGELLELLAPVCEAVAAAHRAGVIHRDLKASNVFVVERGGSRSVKLLDFGIAKLVRADAQGEGLTEPGAIIGTAHNMAPEQIRCERVDERTDIYALGVLIFQLLTGQYPFQSDDPHRVALLHLTAPAPRPSLLARVSPALDAVVLRCLEKQPERRFASAGELLGALRAAVAYEASGAEERDGTALGVQIELSSGDEELDDALLERLMVLIDELELELTAQAFALPLRTASVLLGVRVLLDEAERAEPELLVAELWERASMHAADAAPVAVTMAWTVGPVRYRLTAGGPEPVSGAILDFASWPASARVGE